jgi:hypothetical protein
MKQFVFTENYDPKIRLQCLTVAKSQIPTPPPQPRTTTKATSSSRNIQTDEFTMFLSKDKILTFVDLTEKIKNAG